MSAPWSSDGYVRALRLAAHWHRAQKVTGTEMPYLVHLTSVCNEVQRALFVEPVARPDLAVQGALLHDILEDTSLTFGELAAEMGQELAAVVAALSKDPAIPKQERMSDSLRRIKEQPPEASIIKLADRITNLAPPPTYWTRQKCSDYRDEAEQILATLGAASPSLAARLRERIAAYAVYT